MNEEATMTDHIDDPASGDDAGATPAGWYPDPHGDARQRYWDGTAWTDHFSGDAPEEPVAQATPTTPAPAPATPAAPANRNKTWWVIGAVAAAAVVVVIVVSLSSSGGGGSSSSASGSFCQSFAGKWSTLNDGFNKANDPELLGLNLGVNVGDDSQASQMLQDDQATFKAAAAAASQLAAQAPTALKNDITTDVTNVKQNLTTVSAAFTAAANGDTSQLGALGAGQFEPATTGCEFGSSGPDGKVGQ
jgi:hypothetical protein